MRVSVSPVGVHILSPLYFSFSQFTFYIFKKAQDVCMKSIIRLALLCVILPCLCDCSKSCNREKQENILHVGTNANFPPFESIDQKGELIGFDIDVARALGKVMNKEVVFKEFDFDALILALDKGQIDVIISGLSITESRQKEIAMIPYQGEPLKDLSLLFWESLPDQIASFSALKEHAIKSNLPVSVQSGHFLEQFLKGEGVPLKSLNGPPEQILDIKYRKSFAAVVDSKVGLKLAAEHEGIKNIVLPLPREKWDLGYGIGIKKTRSELISQIRLAVEQLKTDGTLNSLKEKWIKEGL